MNLKDLVDSDKFLSLPMSTQLLFFHLVARANKNGVLNNAKSTSRVVGCRPSDLVLLERNGFVFFVNETECRVKNGTLSNR